MGNITITIESDLISQVVPEEGSPPSDTTTMSSEASEEYFRHVVDGCAACGSPDYDDCECEDDEETTGFVVFLDTGEAVVIEAETYKHGLRRISFFNEDDEEVATFAAGHVVGYADLASVLESLEED